MTFRIPTSPIPKAGERGFGAGTAALIGCE